MTSDKKPIRCVVYTRKSSEEGLEQEFNSLDAQREAGEAYIHSQKHEGWMLLPNRYDDGGISGGTMDRPGLQQLLADVKANRVDVVVVYKVDRLSRSLGDFAQIIDLFDKHSVSFVSVTQQFSTTSSMGRLTLNILLSFAQFEREVTGERIRDKIALSKKKGMWMGGYVPLGYDVASRKLIPNEAETELVRRIFNRFIRLGSTTLLCKELNDDGFRTKRRRGRDGRVSGGYPFNKTTLYKILNNRIYLGEIRHKDKWYPGEHQAIIDQDLWDKAHGIMAKDKTQRAADGRRQTAAPLKGLLYGPDGKAMTPTHTKRGDKRYRYYVTHTANKRGHEECPIRMVRAGDLEGIVFDQIKTVFRNPAMIVSTWKVATTMDDSITEEEVREGLQSIEAVWDHLYHKEQARLLQLFIEKIRVEPEGVHIDMRTNGINSLVLDLKAAARETKEMSA
ncbi:recombinase family protein [uncultured Marinobacter sp.]|uniref:recombinase family protein n=1 Tax=uncultured Marinobacter sp. TaxID=187379 RepID=UPI0030D8ADE4|tara:strand:+ start:49692 stop:51038 length:1347 start_codon:yes stop_codon:yes gene_type:complete